MKLYTGYLTGHKIKHFIHFFVLKKKESAFIKAICNYRSRTLNFLISLCWWPVHITSDKKEERQAIFAMPIFSIYSGKLHLLYFEQGGDVWKSSSQLPNDQKQLRQELFMTTSNSPKKIGFQSWLNFGTGIRGKS
jgi:hypothetical protein